MRYSVDSTMVIFLEDHGISLQINGQCAGYYPGGERKVFVGTDESAIPTRVIFHDRRKSNRNCELMKAKC